MRLTTILTLRGLSMAERIKRLRELAAMTIASKMPLRVRYWTTIQMIGSSTKTSPNVMATTVESLMQEMPRPKSMI